MICDSKSKRQPIPKHFSTLEEAGEFWDTHDLGDYWDQTEEVAMSFRLKRRRHLFAIEPGLARALHEAAAAAGSVQRLSLICGSVRCWRKSVFPVNEGQHPELRPEAEVPPSWRRSYPFPK